MTGLFYVNICMMKIRTNIMIGCLSMLIFGFSSAVLAEGLKAEFSLNATRVAKSVAVPHQFKAQHAQAVLTDEFFNGQTNAVAIYFHQGDIKELDKDYDTVMVLFIDANNKIWQVNLTYMIPGFTAAYTVAWTRKELKELFADYALTKDDLHLKSKGRFQKETPEFGVVELTWDIDVDLPVTNIIGKTEK